VKASARVSVLELAARNEANLSTAQSSAQTHARLSCSYGNTGRTQCAEAAPRQGAQAAGDHDTAKTAWLREIATSRPRLGFTAADRLHRRAEFLSVQRAGSRFQAEHLVIYAARSADNQAVRLGITVSHRLGDAVTRNRIKRRIRECFRGNLRFKFAAGTAVVIIGRPGIGTIAFDSLMRELDTAASKLRPVLNGHHE
jgi:ribonuclease P protein component